jgi:predicted RNA-binding Zn-ribbon protein involved in translation (DUF1610 family)
MNMERPKRRTTYSEEFIAEMIQNFLNKFRSDPRSFSEKLKVIGLSKGGYSHLLNGKNKPNKRTIEVMRAYLEDRPSKFHLIQEGQSFCSSCEQILSSSEMRDEWVCCKCRNEINWASKKRTGAYQRSLVIRALKRNEAGEYRERYLRQKRSYYLRRNYGVMAKCMELIQVIRKENFDVEQEE